MQSYNPPYYSLLRRGYDGRGRSPPRRGYGGPSREQNNGSLLVCIISVACRPDDLRGQSEGFGPVTQ
ncbi:hypothetical protein FRX31_028739 [Thalictrum thalictroides]|uniref:Uncharacterized protein n=1 Tax=Thalictrum thalictroides TaxID=46969 RepID=A0A7J6V9A4_THATH|nr:hypothetical protein FRX31_028739 [Thalictrum thalictroides]